MPLYSRDPSRGSVGVDFLAFNLYFKNRDPNGDFAGVALSCFLVMAGSFGWQVRRPT